MKTIIRILLVSATILFAMLIKAAPLEVTGKGTKKIKGEATEDSVAVYQKVLLKEYFIYNANDSTASIAFNQFIFSKQEQKWIQKTTDIIPVPYASYKIPAGTNDILKYVLNKKKDELELIGYSVKVQLP